MSVDLCRKSIYHRLLEKEFALPDRNRIRDKSGLKIPRPERAVLVRVQQRAPTPSSTEALRPHSAGLAAGSPRPCILAASPGSRAPPAYSPPARRMTAP